MLTPRELYRAQGFPESYVIDEAQPVNPSPKPPRCACAATAFARLACAIVAANTPSNTQPHRQTRNAIKFIASRACTASAWGTLSGIAMTDKQDPIAHRRPPTAFKLVDKVAGALRSGTPDCWILARSTRSARCGLRSTPSKRLTMTRTGANTSRGDDMYYAPGWYR